MLSTSNKILVLLLCSSLVGCLSEDKQASSNNSDSSSASEIMMSSVSSDKNCNPSRQGTIIYDASQTGFFVCVGTSWLPVELSATKGDKGDKGDPGATGAAGAQGPAGTNGRDGMDGEGIRLALRENGQVKGILISFSMEGNQQNALMMLPSGDMIYIDANTGVFSGKPPAVYYSESGCTGTAYTGRSDWWGPHVVGRIYVGPNNSGSPIAFYRALAPVVGSVTAKSHRGYNTVGRMYECVESATNYPASIVRVEEIPAPSSLQHLAPIRFTP